MRSIDLMKRREEEIGELVAFLSEKSGSFTKPKMVVIGGYALRVFVPFSRYSRDCDFVLKRGLETVKAWKPADVTVETFEEHPEHGVMRWSKIIGTGKQAVKLGLDFMQGKVRGRAGEAFTISERFLNDAREAEIKIGSKKRRILVPSYPDFFVLKVMAARRSDVRDIAALVWKNGVPAVHASLRDLNDPEHFYGNLQRKVIPDMEGKFFLTSWRGMFLATEFKDEDRRVVLDAVRGLVQ